MAYPTSDKWKNAVRQSGYRQTVVDLYYNKQTIPVIRDLPVISGTVTVDGSAANRRSGSVTLASVDLISDDPTSTLEPYGLELGIRQGVIYPNGSSEFVPLGIFPIDNIAYDDDHGDLPTVTFFDRSYWIQEQSSQDNLSQYSNRYAIDSINDGLNLSVFHTVDGSPFLNTKIDPVLTPAGYAALIYDDFANSKNFKYPGGTPLQSGTYWDNWQNVAAQLGCQVFWDVDGVNLILQMVPQLDDSNTVADAVATVDAGPNGCLISATRNISRTNAYNAVSYTGVLAAAADSAADPPYVFVSVSDPSSPYFYGGPYGKNVYVTSSDILTQKKDLLNAANTLLKSLVGLSHGLSLTMLPDPSLDAGDIINVIFLDGSSELHMIDTLSIDLAGGPMSVTTIASSTI